VGWASGNSERWSYNFRMLFDQITIIGVGLIGGSVGLAAKARGVAGRILGVDREIGNVNRAINREAIDSGTTDLAEGVRDSGMVVVCVPVDQIADLILKSANHCYSGTLFTDGGSTKHNVVTRVAGKLPSGIEYIPAHPLAGSEKPGVENAHADLFVNRTTVITPIPGTSEESVERVAKFWQLLGSTLAFMPSEDHDRALAVTSHLPHAVAAAVAGATPIDLLSLTAGGFRDVTRIAAGDPRTWAAIFQANRQSVLPALAAFTDRLSEFQKLLEAGDGAGLVRWLIEAKQVRDALGC
jgi:cyclohexadieny/prephenate dehydrogenase